MTGNYTIDETPRRLFDLGKLPQTPNTDSGRLRAITSVYAIISGDKDTSQVNVGLSNGVLVLEEPISLADLTARAEAELKRYQRLKGESQ